MTKPRLVMIIQLVFFSAWGGWLLFNRASASPEIYLETSPVDPRDLLAGTYVALAYPISDPSAGECYYLTTRGLSGYVKLEDSGRTAATAAGTVRIHDVTACSGQPRPGWAKARVEPARAEGGRGRLLYGIERFYLNENDPRKDARSGGVLAKVKLGKDGQLTLLDLVKKL